jgi:hypothetical protein
MALKNKLEFSLHNFQRITWVSEDLKGEWDFCMVELPKAIHDVFTSPEVMKLMPVHLANIHINELYNYKKKMYSKGLFAEHVPFMPSFIQYAFGIQPADDHLPVLTGHRKDIVDFIAHFHDATSLEAIAQLPSGIIQWWNEFSRHDITDKQWAYLIDENREFKESQIYGNTMLNPCWSRLGIMSVPYSPISIHCKESISIAANIKSIAKNLLPAEIYNSWYEILSWPVEWTALHGIAELKTPLFKMIYNTDSTGEKYVLQLDSDTYPDDGLNGLLFPYKKPKKLYFTDSKQNESGIKHLSETLKT